MGFARIDGDGGWAFLKYHARSRGKSANEPVYSDKQHKNGEGEPAGNKSGF